MAAYVIMPSDWMGEYRFATAFFVFLYFFTILSATELLRDAKIKIFRSAVARGIGVGLVLVGSLILFSSRTSDFANNPTVPLSTVKTSIVERHEVYASALHLTSASLLTPDIGALLYYSDLRIYDLAGLTDKTIAKTLGHDQDAFHDYVFEVAKPDFIRTHSVWAARAALDLDPRFRRDYVPLCESFDKQRDIYYGHYVKRTVAQSAGSEAWAAVAALCEYDPPTTLVV